MRQRSSLPKHQLLSRLSQLAVSYNRELLDRYGVGGTGYVGCLRFLREYNNFCFLISMVPVLLDELTEFCIALPAEPMGGIARD